MFVDANEIAKLNKRSEAMQKTSKNKIHELEQKGTSSQFKKKQKEKISAEKKTILRDNFMHDPNNKESERSLMNDDFSFNRLKKESSLDASGEKSELQSPQYSNAKEIIGSEKFKEAEELIYKYEESDGSVVKPLKELRIADDSASRSPLRTKDLGLEDDIITVLRRKEEERFFKRSARKGAEVMLE